MRFERNDPPRLFEVGFDVKRTLSDCGRLELDPDEQVTLTTESGNEYDVTRKSFGFYATSSLNGRLQQFHLRAVLTRNHIGRYFLLLVEEGMEYDFSKYLDEEQMKVVCWMDTSEALDGLEQRIKHGENNDI